MNPATYRQKRVITFVRNRWVAKSDDRGVLAIIDRYNRSVDELSEIEAREIIDALQKAVPPKTN
jgi:hypothetical protein